MQPVTQIKALLYPAPKPLALPEPPPDPHAALKRWAAQCLEDNQYTPDLWNLERFNTQLLFVCNEMLPNCRMHHLIEDYAVKRVTAFTHDLFVFWRKNLGDASYPIPLTHRYPGQVKAPIKGEVYKIKSEQLKHIDRWKMNGVYFERKQVFVDVPYRNIEWDKSVSPVKIEKVPVWMYVGIDAYWEELLDGGIQFTPLKPFINTTYVPKIGYTDHPYYFWNKMQLE